MTRNLIERLAELAERDLRTLARKGVMSREAATAWLPQMEMYAGLGDDFRDAVLARFEPAEPAMVAGRDYLPIEHGVALAKWSSDGEGYAVECHCGTVFFEAGNDWARTRANERFRAHLADVDGRQAHLPLLAERFPGGGR